MSTGGNCRNYEYTCENNADEEWHGIYGTDVRKLQSVLTARHLQILPWIRHVISDNLSQYLK